MVTFVFFTNKKKSRLITWYWSLQVGRIFTLFDLVEIIEKEVIWRKIVGKTQEEMAAAASPPKQTRVANIINQRDNVYLTTVICNGLCCTM